MLHLDDGRLNELLDGELGETAVQEITAHLDACPECHRKLTEAREFMAESDRLIARIELPEPARPPRPASAAGEAQTVRSRLGRYRNLAWAASLVLAAGLGFYASDVRRVRAAGEFAVKEGDHPSPSVNLAPRKDSANAPPAIQTGQPNGQAVSRSVNDQDAASKLRGGGAVASSQPPSVAAPAGATEKAEAKQADARSLAAAPPALRQEASPVANEDRGQSASNQPIPRDAVSPSAAAAKAVMPQMAETARSASESIAPIGKFRVRTEPLAPGRITAVKPSGQGLTAGPLRQPKPTAASFRIISMDQAIRQLSGIIRLIDGMTPDRVETGPGAGVSGADASTELVRVVYLDPPGREILLDQQRVGPPVEARADQAQRRGPDLLPGDTLVAMTQGQGRRVNWMDGAGFWLALSGNLSADSLVSLARRIR